VVAGYASVVLALSAVLGVPAWLLNVWQLAFTPDEKLLFTTNGTSNDVTAIDVDPGFIAIARSR
jgi:hypothetical protein